MRGPLSFAAAVLLLTACKDAAKSSDAVDAGSITVATNPPAASAIAPSTDEDRVRKAVVAWSDALDKHDANALEAMYAPRVGFYGHEVSRSAVMAAKRRALGPTSTFHQSIEGDVSVDAAPTGWRARFSKRSGGAAKSGAVTAQLTFASSDAGSLLISEETDDPTIAREKQRPTGDCQSVASSVVNALPEVQSLLASTQKELSKYPDRSMGGVGPLDEDDGGFTVGLGVHQPDRYEAQVWYTVTATGKITVTVMGSDVRVPPAGKATIERACKKS